MQNLGLANMGAYPYVRAAIIGQSINSFNIEVTTIMTNRACQQSEPWKLCPALH